MVSHGELRECRWVRNLEQITSSIPRSRMSAEAVNALTNGNGADIVIDNVGTHQTLMQALSAVHRGGRIVMVGETEDTIPLSNLQLCVNEARHTGFEVRREAGHGRSDSTGGKWGRDPVR